MVVVGRLAERKGFDRLIEAMPGVRRAVPDVRLQIMGDGPQRAELEALRAHGSSLHLERVVGRLMLECAHHRDWLSGIGFIEGQRALYASEWWRSAALRGER